DDAGRAGCLGRGHGCSGCCRPAGVAAGLAQWRGVRASVQRPQVRDHRPLHWRQRQGAAVEGQAVRDARPDRCRMGGDPARRRPEVQGQRSDAAASAATGGCGDRGGTGQGRGGGRSGHRAGQCPAFAGAAKRAAVAQRIAGIFGAAAVPAARGAGPCDRSSIRRSGGEGRRGHREGTFPRTASGAEAQPVLLQRRRHRRRALLRLRARHDDHRARRRATAEYRIALRPWQRRSGSPAPRFGQGPVGAFRPAPRGVCGRCWRFADHSHSSRTRRPARGGAGRGVRGAVQSALL
ncbi:MAG: hypothetical protein AVDCRST_MAG44-1494, partial [uncultured Sphingomonas sp.]